MQATKTKRTMLLGIVLTAFCGSNASAVPIDREDFAPSAVEYDFANAPIGTFVVVEGNLTVSNGIVSADGWDAAVAPSYFDGGDSSVLRLDFADEVSAVGMDFITNRADVTLRIYDAANALLASLTMDYELLPPNSNGGAPYGFIGIDFLSNAIAWVSIDTPRNGNELYIDDIIYQYMTVPTPGSLALMLLGGVLLAARRRFTTRF